MSAAPKPTSVYVIGFTDGVIKVGRTSNWTNRRAKHAQDGRIRRATIKNEWVLEHEHADRVERSLILLGRCHLQPLVGEYFSGDYRRFMKTVLKKFRRWGIVQTEWMTFEQVMAEFGVSAKDLLWARTDKSLNSYHHIFSDSPQAFFVRSEVEKWFSRYGLADRITDRKAEADWRAANRDSFEKEYAFWQAREAEMEASA